MKILRFFSMLLLLFLMLACHAIDVPFKDPESFGLLSAPVSFTPLVHGHPLIPIRHLSQSLGMEILGKYPESFTLKRDGLVIEGIGYNVTEVNVNGEIRLLPDPIQAWWDRYYLTERTVPIVFPGATLTFDEKSRKVTVTLGETSVEMIADTHFLFPDPEFIKRFHGAAASGDIEFIDKMRYYRPSWIDIPDVTGYTALHRAVEANRIESVRALVDKNLFHANVNAAAVAGDTPLILAAENDNLEIARFLIKHGARVSAMGRNGDTALHHAAEQGDTKMMLLLLDNRAWVNAADSDKDTPLHLAVREGHFESVSLLLARGARTAINRQNTAGYTPLITWANSTTPTREMADLLLRNGANTNIRNGADMTAVDILRYRNSPRGTLQTSPLLEELLKLLRKYGYRGK